MDPTYLIIATIAFLLAGTIKGTVGIGLPVTTVGILSQVGDPRLAVVLSIIPIALTNVWQVYSAGGFINALKENWLMALPLVIVLYLAALAAPFVPADIFMIFLGLVIVIFAMINLFAKIPMLPEKLDVPSKIVAGIFAGFFGGLTAIWAPPMVIYFVSKRLDKNQFISSIGAMFLIGSVPLLLGYIQSGQLSGQAGMISLALCIPATIGFFVGAKLRNSLPAETFRKLVLVTFLVTGLNILRIALFQ